MLKTWARIILAWFSSYSHLAQSPWTSSHVCSKVWFGGKKRKMSILLWIIKVFSSPFEVTSPSGRYYLTTPKRYSLRKIKWITETQHKRFDFIHQTKTIFLYLIHHFAGCYCDVTWASARSFKSLKVTVKISKKKKHSILTWFYSYDNTCVLNVWSLLKCKRNAPEFEKKTCIQNLFK